MNPYNMVYFPHLIPKNKTDSMKHGTQLVTSLQSPILRYPAIYLWKLILSVFNSTPPFISQYYIFQSISYVDSFYSNTCF